MAEPFSVVILTRDEAANVRDCLDAVLGQLGPEDEIVVVDRASGDATVTICERYVHEQAGLVRMHVFPEPVPFAEARDMGVAMARHEALVLLSADAVPEAGWLDALRAALANADLAYGRLRHAPRRLNAATVSRGLRYHRFERPGDALPETFASSVNVAARRSCLVALQHADVVPGSEDVALARAARLTGFRIAYARGAVVRRRDVASWTSEWRTRAREGAATAALRGLLGAPRLHLAWAVAVVGLAVAAVALASPWILALCLAAFFAPTIRRLASPAAWRYRPPELVAGAAVSPLFDLAFLGSYLAHRTRGVRRNG